MLKEDIREICLKNYKTAKRNHDIITNIYDSKVIENNKIIAVYYPLKNEIDILGLMSLYPRKVFCFPRIENDILCFYMVENIDELVKGPFSVLQPHKNRNNKILLNEIEAFIIPCVGVNKSNYRLGYGRGFYDKTLKGLSAKMIGTCYCENIGIDFIEEEHDLKLDYVFKR